MCELLNYNFQVLKYCEAKDLLKIPLFSIFNSILVNQDKSLLEVFFCLFCSVCNVISWICFLVETRQGFPFGRINVFEIVISAPKKPKV